MRDHAFLEVRGLKKHFPGSRNFFGRPRTWIKAVDGVDLTVRRGETLAVVGESGCGKTTLGKCVAKLLNPDSGSIMFDGMELTTATAEYLNAVRNRIQMVFQATSASLDPRMRTKKLVAEGLTAQKKQRLKHVESRIMEMLASVGLGPDDSTKYPHMFSGGQRQRVVIARALVMEPDLIVLDEPTSALDVSIQAQILNLLKQLQQRMDLTYILITHDMRSVRFMADRVAVMYLGRIVEIGSREQILRTPVHPYTKKLLAAVPVPDPGRSLPEEETAEKEALVSSEITGGCSFYPRCPIAVEQCRVHDPPLIEVHQGHLVACPPGAAKGQKGAGWTDSLVPTGKGEEQP